MSVLEEQDASAPAGEIVGNYQLVSRLGEGGMGVVYLAQHRNIERQVAIKLLQPAYSTDRETVQRFLTEARAASRVHHPAIVEVFDCGIHQDGRVYIVMELLQGCSLAAEIKANGRLSLDRALWLTTLIADGFAAVHGVGIIHRDLKPDNLFLVPARAPGEPFAVKVLDFGLAKCFKGTLSRNGVVTRTGHVMGSPAYMSPEQCRGASRIDLRADIYSLGCVLYEMICGRPPFVRAGSGDLLVAHIGMMPAPPSALEQSIPEEVEALIMRMLAKSPDERPQTMQEVAQAAELCRERLASAGDSRGPRVLVARTLAADARAARSRRRWRLALCAAAAALAATPLIALRGRPDPGPRPDPPARAGGPASDAARGFAGLPNPDPATPSPAPAPALAPADEIGLDRSIAPPAATRRKRSHGLQQIDLMRFGQADTWEREPPPARAAPAPR